MTIAKDGLQAVGANLTEDAQKRVASSEHELHHEIYERLLPELMALPAKSLVGVNLDVVSAVITALGVLPKIAALRDTMVNVLGDFDAEQFDRLRDYAMALFQANADYAIATRPPDGLEAVAKECTQMRQTLLLEATVLVRRGLLREGHLKRLNRRNGYTKLADDVLTLGALLSNNWSAIAGHCGVKLEELQRAEQLTLDLCRIVGRRRHNKAKEIAEAAEMRTRAFTAFTRAYGNIRRAVVYLRWHQGDADTFMPSLYQGHGGRARKAVDAAARRKPSPEASSSQPGAAKSTSAAAKAPLLSPITPATSAREIAANASAQSPIEPLAVNGDTGPFMS